MSVKFISKNSNYMIVLKPGIEGNRALGTHAVSGLYVKFQDGIVDVKEEEIIKMLREHDSFGVDFVEVKADEVDPYADTRTEIEPTHITTEMDHGTPGKRVGKVPIKITPLMRKLIEEEAIKMIPGLLKSNPDILKNVVVNLAADMKAKEETPMPIVAPGVPQEAPKTSKDIKNVKTLKAPKVTQNKMTQAPEPIEDDMTEKVEGDASKDKKDAEDKK